MTCATKTLRHGRSRGRPPVPVCTGSRKVSRTARMSDTKPSVQTNRGRWAAQRLTRSISRRINDMSRCSLTSPPSHKRVQTIIAKAIQTIPPCFLTRISSACTCPRSRGCSTRCSCTACPWAPPRATHPATVRSSEPNATTSAWRGHPWASSVTTRLTVSAEVRRREKAVPFVALNVLWHSVQRKRLSLHEWMPMLPWPVCPLAGHATLGQNVVVGSMLVSSESRWGTYQEEVCLDPHFHCKRTIPRLAVELPLGRAVDKTLLDSHQTTVPTFFDNLQIHIALGREVFGQGMTIGCKFIRRHTHALVVQQMDQFF